MKFIKKDIYDAIEYSINNPQISITKIGELFNIDRHQISKYKQNDLYLEYKYNNKSNPNDDNLYYFSEDELLFINNYINNPNKSFKEIKEISNCFSGKRETLYKYLDILGLNKTEGKNIKYHYNRNAFKEINTEEDAYWLGFITADGCIIEKRWLYIGLAEKDIEHLKKFCKYIELNNKETEQIISHSFGGAYTKDNPIVGVKICCLNIIENLKNKGITPRKSGKEKPYICKNNLLEKAYIRGLIDGDGYLRKNGAGMGIVGSYEICSYVQEFFNKNITDLSKSHIREHGSIYKFEFTGKNQCSKVAKFLYKDANIYLQRKYELFLKKYNN